MQRLLSLPVILLFLLGSFSVSLGDEPAKQAVVPALRTDIEFAKVANVSLTLDAFVPEGPGPFPTCILVHGGGWNAGDKSGGPKKGYMAPMHEPLEKAGFAWFSINYRLASFCTDTCGGV